VKKQEIQEIPYKIPGPILIKFKAALKINGPNSSGIRREAGFKMLENRIFFKNELKSNFEKRVPKHSKIGGFSK
jgi:hypothetical protein